MSRFSSTPDSIVDDFEFLSEATLALIREGIPADRAPRLVHYYLEGGPKPNVAQRIDSKARNVIRRMIEEYEYQELVSKYIRERLGLSN